VPWDEWHLMAMITQAFPEGGVADVATLKTQGLLSGDLSRLNAHLIPHGWQLDLVRDQGRVVGAVRRRASADAVEAMNGEPNKRRKRRDSKDGC
jgi:hypothetical protein